MEKKLGRYVGIVKRWNPMRGYGFVCMLKGNRHITDNNLVFVYRNDVNEEYKNLFDQQVVEFDLYEIHTDDKKVQYKARDLRQIRSGFKIFSAVWRGSEFRA